MIGAFVPIGRLSLFTEGRLIVTSDIQYANVLVGTSLVAVTSFGLTTALNYAASGLVDWALAGVFVAGGLIGSTAGLRMAKRLSAAGQLSKAFAALIFAVAAYMLWKSGAAAFG